MMKFAVQHGMGDSRWSPPILDPDNVVAFATTAEQSGWSALAFTDHPAPSAKWVANGGEGSSDVFASLSFCAAVTSSIRLLTLVLVLPYRNPLFTVHQIATLDRLSAGRLTLGVGTGYLRGEFRALGVELDDRRRLFDEAVKVLHAAWAAGPTAAVSIRGRSFDSPGTVLAPPLVQLPHPPMWIHANGTFGTTRAACYGDGALITMTTAPLARTIRTAPVPDLNAVRTCIASLHREMDRLGRPRDEVEIALGGNWPMLDARVGWNIEQRCADVVALEDMGVDWIVCPVVGDDAAVAEETARQFGNEIVLQFTDTIAE